MKTLHETLAESDPKLQRGIIHCRTCGRVEKVDSAHCLAHGWPECCGATMSLGEPETNGTPIR
jgi:hypothetical protein